MRLRGAAAHMPTDAGLTAAEVIVAIEQRGGRIWLDSGRVRFHVPPGRAVSIELIRAMKRREAELVDRLTNRRDSPNGVA